MTDPEDCAGDEVHCSCVPHLRRRIKELEADLDNRRAAVEVLAAVRELATGTYVQSPAELLKRVGSRVERFFSGASLESASAQRDRRLIEIGEAAVANHRGIVRAIEGQLEGEHRARLIELRYMIEALEATNDD